MASILAIIVLPPATFDEKDLFSRPACSYQLERLINQPYRACDPNHYENGCHSISVASAAGHHWSGQCAELWGPLKLWGRSFSYRFPAAYFFGHQVELGVEMLCFGVVCLVQLSPLQWFMRLEHNCFDDGRDGDCITLFALACMLRLARFLRRFTNDCLQQNCINNMRLSTPCVPVTDQCLCENTNFQAGIRDCATQACTAADATAAIDYANSFCVSALAVSTTAAATSEAPTTTDAPTTTAADETTATPASSAEATSSAASSIATESSTTAAASTETTGFSVSDPLSPPPRLRLVEVANYMRYCSWLFGTSSPSIQ